MGQIAISKMRFYTYNGVFAEENKLGQQISIDIIIDYPIEEKVKDDDLTTTISYADVYEDIKNYVSKNNFNLLETLANNLLRFLLDKYSLANEIKLTVHKHYVPMPGIYDDVSVSVSGCNSK